MLLHFFAVVYLSYYLTIVVLKFSLLCQKKFFIA